MLALKHRILLRRLLVTKAETDVTKVALRFKSRRFKTAKYQCPANSSPRTEASLSSQCSTALTVLRAPS